MHAYHRACSLPGTAGRYNRFLSRKGWMMGSEGMNQEPRRGSQESCRTTLSLWDLIKEWPASAQLHFRTATDPILKPSIFPPEKECPPTVVCCVLSVHWGRQITCLFGSGDLKTVGTIPKEPHLHGSDLNTSRLWCCDGSLEDPGRGWMCSACEQDPNHWGSEDR